MYGKMSNNFFYSSILITLLLCHSSVLFSSAQDFDFFYFVQQWPGSYCDTRQSCCYPSKGKPPSDFGIHGLWPNYGDGTYPSNCDPSNSFDQSQISDLITEMEQNWASLACPSSNGFTFWSHEWNKHGTCSESVLDQHSYFSVALELKQKINLLQILRNAGIEPDGSFYKLSDVVSAIENGIGHTPYIQCNVDPDRNSQLYQVFICVDKSSGTELIDCPVLPRGQCPSTIEFPAF